MKRKIKFVRNNKTEAFSDGLKILLDDIHEMKYRELQTCLAYFSFVMACCIMRADELRKFGANTVIRETLDDMKATCIFGVQKAVEVEFTQEIKTDKVCTFLGDDEEFQVWEIDLDA